MHLFFEGGFFALVLLCFIVRELRLCQRRALCGRDSKECLLLPDAFVKRANNRRLSFPPPLSGEGPGPRGEEVGTKNPAPILLALPKIPGTGAQKQLLSRKFSSLNSFPGGRLRSRAGDVATMPIQLKNQSQEGPRQTFRKLKYYLFTFNCSMYFKG